MVLCTVVAVTAALGFPGAVDLNVQTDWSGGPGVAGPGTPWADRFDQSTGSSWRSIPGQLALSCSPLATTVPHTLTGGLTVANATHAADVDGDGDTDVVGAQYLSLGWWERLSDGTW